MCGGYPEIGIEIAFALGCATSPTANWIKSNSCSGTTRSKPPNDTSGPSKSYEALLTKVLASNRMRTADRQNPWAADRPPLGDCSLLITADHDTRRRVGLWAGRYEARRIKFRVSQKFILAGRTRDQMARLASGKPRNLRGRSRS